MKAIIRFFDKLEDRVRGWLSHRPFLYALVVGSAAVLFWRGVWGVADNFNLSAVGSIVISVIILLMTGALVSEFIGKQIIVSGLKGEKKMEEKTLEELSQEESELTKISKQLTELDQDVEDIKKDLDKK